jgi:hypothetical protein
MPTPYQEARQWFSNFPAELFSLWFDERIEVNGWPPTSDIWHQVLCYKSIEFWRNLVWRKQSFDLARVQFGTETLRVVNGVIRSMLGENNEFTGIKDHAQRTLSILDFIEANKRLPGTLIFIVENGRYEVVEGCHRLAMFVHLSSVANWQTGISSLCSAWVGSLGERKQIAT